MLPPVPDPRDYGVSPAHGFLPAEWPLQRLPDPYYDKWEAIVANLQGLLLSRRLRGVVDALPVLSTARLHDEAEWRRAYSILGFIAHAYIWGGDKPSDRLPPGVSIPFLAVSAQLELPPVATYAGVCLWNFKPLFADEPSASLDNLCTLTTFTGSLDESWFYLVSVAIEECGAPIIPTMLSAIGAARRGESAKLTRCLQFCAERLDDLGGLLQRMYENCDPHVFYHRIRPFLAGSKNMADAGLPHGVVYDDGTGAGVYRQYSGGSNAQSSLMQFFDLALGVEHHPAGDSKHNFIMDMREYMPGPHRRFLEHVATVANIRQYVHSHRWDRTLCTAYDACLAMLRSLRDKHIQMVSRYIIVKSRESRAHSRSASPRAAVNLATASSSSSYSAAAAAATTTTTTTTTTTASSTVSTTTDTQTASAAAAAAKNKQLRGTGGTALIPFLKQARDETGEPAVEAWTRRLLGARGPAEVTSADPALAAGKAGSKVAQQQTVEIVGLAGTWTMDDSEGGLCHW